MDQANPKPKTLLLRKRFNGVPEASESVRWARLGKALKTFTDFEELEVDANDDFSPSNYLEGQDHLFLDADLAPWVDLEKSPLPGTTLIFDESMPWNELANRQLYLKTLTRHPSLVLDDLNVTDLVRILHLFLMPKRLAGVVPVMEKGSLIVGEKVMDRHNIGSLIDRLSAYFDKTEGLLLKARIPDLRQVLFGLIQEGLRCATSANVTYPFVDFQASAGAQKLSVNMRFPRGDLNFDQLTGQVLSGSAIFWQQVWLCSDVLVLNYHKQHEEIEVTLLICHAERNSKSLYKSFLFKTSERSAKKENLLEAPANFTFKALSDIHSRKNEQVLISENGNGSVDEIDFGSLPANVSEKIHSLDEQCRSLSENIQKKDAQLQAAVRKSQQLERDLAAKRGELIRAGKMQESRLEASETRIRELESALEKSKKTSHENAITGAQNSAPANQEALSRLEAMLRAAENEKNHLRETITHEQKRVTIFEQKYSSLYKDISLKEREINDLKAAFGKIRKEKSSVSTNQASSPEISEKTSEKSKEADDRESTYKQELRKLTFKLESQEKNTKAIQNESAEKLKMLDQKLKIAKAKEIELLKKIEDLMSSLKKAVKAA